mmetsp:Transcript_3331/g.10360  ORF Transcript_3331/g.10360 Transcript_3331/m.10360 type:complete len:241 (+) Transcript_3331:162-884(+)
MCTDGDRPLEAPCRQASRRARASSRSNPRCSAADGEPRAGGEDRGRVGLDRRRCGASDSGAADSLQFGAARLGAHRALKSSRDHAPRQPSRPRTLQRGQRRRGHQRHHHRRESCRKHALFVAAAQRADGSRDKEPEEGCAGVSRVGPTRRAGGRAPRAGGRVRQAARDARERRGQGVGQVQAAAGGRGGASRCRSGNIAGRADARGARGRGGAGGRGPACQRIPSCQRLPSRLPSRRRVF